jgi:hypothetical protein
MGFGCCLFFMVIDDYYGYWLLLMALDYYGYWFWLLPIVDGYKLL